MASINEKRILCLEQLPGETEQKAELKATVEATIEAWRKAADLNMRRDTVRL